MRSGVDMPIIQIWDVINFAWGVLVNLGFTARMSLNPFVAISW